ncbi:TPA: hypothetical protein ACXYK5_003094 [Legionella pneumophila]
MSYKDFSSFHDIKLLFGNPQEDLNYGYMCLPNFQCDPNPLFEDNFFLLYRRSEYAAQIELTCSKIFKALMGYGPELEIIKQNDEFYIASRRIRNFKEGCPNFDGLNKFKHISGLAAMFVISYFLCETDMHSGNFGVQDLGEERRAYRIDMVESLDLEMLRTTLELSSLKQIPYIAEKHYQGMTEMDLPQGYVKSDDFQNEKLAMIQLIADTPFSFFENIIRTTITSNLYEHQQTVLQKLVATVAVEDKDAVISMQETASKMDASENNVDFLLNLLKNRHERWRLLACKENIEQDFSLADASLFYKQLELYDRDSTNSEDEESFSLGSNFSDLSSGVGFFNHSKEMSDDEEALSETEDVMLPEFPK